MPNTSSIWRSIDKRIKALNTGTAHVPDGALSPVPPPDAADRAISLAERDQPETPMRGLTEDEYATLKQVVKQKFGDLATVRIHREKYCAGAVDIRPTKASGRRWNLEQLALARSILDELDLGFSSKSYLDHEDPLRFYGDGFHFLKKRT